MSKVLLKTKIVMLILIASFFLTACVYGLPTQEKYEQLISGVNAFYKDDLTKFYSITILTDNTKFNTEIEKQPYEVLEIKPKHDLKVKGIVFVLRSSEKTTLNFQIYTNEIMLLSTTKNVEKDKDESIEMFFENTQNISKNSSFKIKVTEENLSEENENTAFVFDTLFIFLNEE